MGRACMVLILSGLGTLVAIAAEPPANPGLVPSRAYVPTAGDEVFLVSPKAGKVAVAKDLKSRRKYTASRKVTSAIALVEDRSAVRILSTSPPEAGGQDGPIGILVLDGRSRGWRGFVEPKAVVRLVPADQAEAPAVREMVPDPGWEPKPGEMATVYPGSTPTAAFPESLASYRKFTAANDDVGMRQLVERKAIVIVPRGVEVLVIKRHDFRRQGEAAREAPRVVSSAELSRMATQSALRQRDEEPPPPPNLLEVRFRSGPLQDQVKFVPEADIKRLVPGPVESSLKIKAGMARGR